MPELEDEPRAPSEGSKKKEKVRSIWISFVGRIVAPIVRGARAIAVLPLDNFYRTLQTTISLRG